MLNCIRGTAIALEHNTNKARAPLSFGLFVAATLSFAAHAGSLSDPFRTDAQLQRDTNGLTDPLGHDCVIPSGNLTFPAAVNLALCRNPQTRSAWAQAHQQAAALGISESAWLPNISATGSESRDFGKHADINGNIVSSAQNTGDATINLSWTLYDFGARSGRIKSASRLLDAAAATASRVVQQTVSTVVQSYYGSVGGDAGLVAARATEDIAAHSLEIARALQTGGVGALGDVLQAQTAYEQAVLARVQAEAAAKSAKGTLAVTLGGTADQPFRLAPEPVPSEVPALAARMADLMAEAARQRPDLAAAQAQRDSAEANITVARAAGRPSISIGALHSFTSTTGVPKQNYDQVGITVTVPIFTGFNVNYGVRQAQAALQVSEANLEQVGLNVTLDVWNGYYTLDSANQQLTATADLLNTAEQNEQVALGRYKAGVGSIVDVLTAQTALATARQLRINAELGWKVARAQLALALGRLSSAQPLTDGTALP
jgi:TolC family type I secretion outer membrane protein